MDPRGQHADFRNSGQRMCRLQPVSLCQSLLRCPARMPGPRLSSSCDLHKLDEARTKQKRLAVQSPTTNKDKAKQQRQLAASLTAVAARDSVATCIPGQTSCMQKDSYSLMMSRPPLPSLMRASSMQPACQCRTPMTTTNASKKSGQATPHQRRSAPNRKARIRRMSVF